MITKMKDGRPVLAKLKGKYWMYWGEHFVNLAWSENLADWHPLLDATGALKQTMKTRPGKFDSDLTECGPPALITDKGILLLYNGKNATDERALNISYVAIKGVHQQKNFPASPTRNSSHPDFNKQKRSR